MTRARVQHHLIIGGQRSGKSRHAHALARQWQGAAPDRHVTVLATAQALDDEMRVRIERHRRDRHPAFETLEEPLDLAAALERLDDARRLVLVDCLTLWVTNWLMPAGGGAVPDAPAASWPQARDALLHVLPRLASPVVLVGNELGWGVLPPSAAVRHFVDEHGRLNQAVAERCARVTLMVAGQPWTREVGS